MKKIVCELCEGTEFTKENGMFVCHGCGTRYTAEEARGMMREVEGDAPVVTGAPVVAAPVGNQNQQQIDNLLVLATNAFESSNNQEAENYCNRAIELDVTCYKAWLLKGQAIGWQSTYGSPRVVEGANAMRKAVDFAPEDEKEDVAKQALRAIRNICIALQSLAKENFANSPTEERRNKFFEFSKVCADATDVFNDVSTEIRQVSFDEWKEQKRKMAEFMNLAGVAAVNSVRERWNDIDHPNKNSWDTYLDWFGEISNVFENSIDNGVAVDEDDEEIITRYKNRIIAIKEPIDSCCYKQEWQSWSSSYVWVRDYYLSDSAKSARRNLIKQCEDAIKKIQNKAKEKEEAEKRAAEEARKQRIEAYWEAHADEKAALEREKEELSAKVDSFTPQVSDLEAQIKATKPTGDVPSEEETKKIKDQIKELESRRAKLGMFAGKEKKQIGEEIASLNGRVDSLKAKIEEEKKARQAEADKKIAPLQAKIDELRGDLDKARKRISAIEAELTKDPEE